MPDAKQLPRDNDACFSGFDSMKPRKSWFSSFLQSLMEDNRWETEAWSILLAIISILLSDEKTSYRLLNDNHRVLLLLFSTSSVTSFIQIMKKLCFVRLARWLLGKHLRFLCALDTRSIETSDSERAQEKFCSVKQIDWLVGMSNPSALFRLTSICRLTQNALVSSNQRNFEPEKQLSKWWTEIHLNEGKLMVMVPLPH